MIRGVSGPVIYQGDFNTVSENNNNRINKTRESIPHPAEKHAEAILGALERRQPALTLTSHPQLFYLKAQVPSGIFEVRIEVHTN